MTTSWIASGAWLSDDCRIIATNAMAATKASPNCPIRLRKNLLLCRTATMMRNTTPATNKNGTQNKKNIVISLVAFRATGTAFTDSKQ